MVKSSVTVATAATRGRRRDGVEYLKACLHTVSRAMRRSSTGDGLPTGDSIEHRLGGEREND